MVRRNILSEFKFTGNWPYTPNVFTELHFAPSNVTDRAMGHGDSADLLEFRTPVLTSESLLGDAIDLHSAASINVVGIDKLQVEPSRLIYEIAVTPQNNLCLNKQPSPFTSYISPSDILNIPRAPPRKQNQHSETKTQQDPQQYKKKKHKFLLLLQLETILQKKVNMKKNGN